MTANPNTATTASPVATITVTAGKAERVTLTANQNASVDEYPKTAAELEKAISQTWNFPATSDFTSLEFGAGKSYSILSKKPLTRTADPNTYLLAGTYTVSADLRTLTLSEFGTVDISTMSADIVSVTLKPTGAEPQAVTLNKQKYDTPPAAEHKLIKTITTIDEEGSGTLTFTWDNTKRLTAIRGSAGADGQTIQMEYPDASTVRALYPQGAVGELAVTVKYNLNTAGLAVSATLQEGSITENVQFSYSNKRELTSIRCYDNSGNLKWYRTASWNNGNMTSAYFWSKHICDDTSYEDEEGNRKYVHDHNGDGVYNNQDKSPSFPPETRTEIYKYSTELNKAKTFYPFAYGDFWGEDMIGGIYTGILGVMNQNLPAEAQDEGAQFKYTFTDGYPTTINVNYPDYPEGNYLINMNFE